MGDQENGDPRSLIDVPEQLHNLVLGLLVQIAGRLVSQQDRFYVTTKSAAILTLKCEEGLKLVSPSGVSTCRSGNARAEARAILDPPRGRGVAAALRQAGSGPR